MTAQPARACFALSRDGAHDRDRDHDHDRDRDHDHDYHDHDRDRDHDHDHDRDHDHYFRVRAVVQAGEEDWSQVVSLGTV